MTISLGGLLTLMTPLLQGVPTTHLTEIDRKDMIHNAVKHYNAIRPRRVSKRVTGTGKKWYQVEPVGTGVLPSWVADFSFIESIEYPAPVILNDELPIFLDDQAWGVYLSDAVKYLVLVDVAPATSEQFTVHHTAPHVWSTDPDPTITLPTEHERPVAWLGASFCCDALAIRYALLSEDSFGSDSNDFAAYSKAIAKQALRLNEQFNRYFGVPSSDPGALPVRARAAASVIGDWDTRTITGGDYLFHRGRAQ